MSKYQIIGFLVFNIGLILSGYFIWQLAVNYEIDVFHLLPLIFAMLIIIMGLMGIAFGKADEKFQSKK